MLSILIPAYNYDVTNLVKKLHYQAVNSNIVFEILVLDDGSTRCVEANSRITTLPNCRHIVLECNVGRSVVRNKLAALAQFTHLLFLDCDADIQHPDFIQNYVPWCSEQVVVLGGRTYNLTKSEFAYSLQKKYGLKRERNDPKIVLRGKNFMFTSPNFLIPASIFEQVKFDETIVGYGHEDTILGLHLRRMNIPILRIDNPVVHVGLDENTVFLEKSKKAIENLFTLYSSGKYPELSDDSKLLKWFLVLKKWRLAYCIALKYRLLHIIIERCLCVKHPSLLLFDGYKLMWLCNIGSKKMTT